MKAQWSKTYGMQQKQLYILFGWAESWLWHLGFSIFFMACKIFIYFFSCGMWDLVLWPGIELGLPALGVWSLRHWITREVPQSAFNWSKRSSFLNWPCIERFSVVTLGQGCSWQCYTLPWGVEARDTSRPTVMHRIVHGNTDFACLLTAGDDIACYKFVSVKSWLRDLPGDPGYHD